MIAQVILPLPFDTAFSYLVEEYCAPGTIVAVPFRNTKYLGVIRDCSDEVSTTQKLKAIISETGYRLEDKCMDFLDFVSRYNMIPLGMVYKMCMGSLNLEACSKVSVQDETLVTSNVVLSTEQKEALSSLKTHTAFDATVLQGVTGSGKTEVYLERIRELISSGKQALILLPEIFLTTQLIERFKKRMSCPVVEWHSSIAHAKKQKYFKHIISGDAKLIVGARSALFLPFKNLGCIVVDEEHEASFKQTEQGCYHARDMAVMRAKIEKIPIILSSATPSVETEYNVKKGRYRKVLLDVRYGTASMPRVEVVDILKNRMKSGQWVTEHLRSKIRQFYAEGKQSLLYMNRRGYSAITICLECRSKVSCPHCAFNLVLHKHKNILLCHYCGFTKEPSQICPTCGSDNQFVDVGPGVEKVASEVSSFIPEASLMVLSSDTIGTRKKAASAIKEITDGKIDIIIGTQMVTKGVHFPKLDLVGVLDADMGLFAGDVRAFERTYQVIKQVSGRAGRESSSGLVCLQTIEPESYLIQSILKDDWDGFINRELVEREAAFVPPFSRVVIITFADKNLNRLRSTLSDVTKLIPSIDGLRVLGPSQDPVFMLRGTYRYRFIFIAKKELAVQKIVKQWLSSVNINKAIDVRTDVDAI